ncbi:hypothetical protein [Nocardioides acrostichi]|uniref:Uncharacterized protein n=1 Tax=Nocardioides acrostichi TaxID=2784339 RepID=A0A930V392_9ACTN|nr:hypothetical protein [Nocardioides acrostichi]MBF4162930.1 hypothetical protein [Nocardioides acrostichi]
MERVPHENVATVLVDPTVLHDLEVHLMSLDLRPWPIATAPICADGPRRAFQVRRRMLMARRGAWDDAEHWTPVWVSFGESWRDGEEPLPWRAHQVLWDALARYAGHVHYRRCLGGVPKLDVPHERVA